MTQLKFEYMLAYADMYDMMSRPFEDIMQEIENSFEKAHEGDEQDNYFNETAHMVETLERYHSMYEKGLENDCKFFTAVLGEPMWAAFNEFDV